MVWEKNAKLAQSVHLYPHQSFPGVDGSCELKTGQEQKFQKLRGGRWGPQWGPFFISGGAPPMNSRPFKPF